MKRHFEEKSSSSPGNISEHVRTLFTNQYIAWGKRWWKRKDFLLFLSEACYSVTPRSSNKWTTALHHQDCALNESSGAGRPNYLSEEKNKFLQIPFLTKMRKILKRIRTLLKILYWILLVFR